MTREQKLEAVLQAMMAGSHNAKIKRYYPMIWEALESGRSRPLDAPPFATLRGSDLRCGRCGGPAVDVAPDYLIDAKAAVSFRCAEGHFTISGYRPPGVGP